MLYPIGIQSFSEIRKGNYTYVDKTNLIYKLVKEGKVYFLSRPRRFGKSLLVSTLEAYFQGNKKLFDGLAMESLEKDWIEYPVIHLDFNGGNYRESGELKKSILTFLSLQERIYGRDEIEQTISTRFIGIIRRAHEKTGKKVVVLVDEYDKPMLDVLDDVVLSKNENRIEEKNRELLKELYSTFKSCDNDLKFVFLTGVTKFSQVSVFSGFNQPEDISMNGDYDALCGITKEEVLSYFKTPISQMAAKEEVNFDKMAELLKQNYDGYHFSEDLIDVFNPFSMLNAMKSKRIKDYWFATGTPTYLVRLLKGSHVNIQEYINRPHRAAEFVDYKADKASPFPMLYQSGYLTIKRYEKSNRFFWLDFPNNEVRNGFLLSLTNSYMKEPNATDSWANDSVINLQSGEIETFMKRMKGFLSGIPYEMHTEDKERYFQYTFYLLLRILGCTIPCVELHTSEGRIDLVYETSSYIYIFEFKRDGSVKKALQQIDETHYADRYAGDSRKVYKIGANFSSTTWSLDGWIIEEKN